MDEAEFWRWAKEWETTLASPDIDWDALFTPVDDDSPSTAELLHEAAALPPGADAVGLISGIDVTKVTAEEALQLVGLWERQSRWLVAQQHAAAVKFAGPQSAGGSDAAKRQENSDVLELALTVDCSVDLTRVRLEQARRLATTFSATRAALAMGTLSEYRARRIVEELAVLDPDQARAIEAQVLPGADECSVRELVRKLRREAVRARGPEAVDDHLAGVDDRRVVVDSEAREPGLLGLHAYLPPAQTIAMNQTLEAKAAEFARADRRTRDEAKAAGASELPGRRTKDQRMADALAWFVLGPSQEDQDEPAHPHVQVQVTIDLPTLLHLRENPGKLGGYGPIPADIARELAQDGTWRRFVHDPVTGYLMDQGDIDYVPCVRLSNFTEARDVRCRFPRSTRSARRADNDHLVPHRKGGGGGRTSAVNLARESKLAHIAKTHNGWKVSGDANGVLHWRTPHGQEFRSAPHDYRPDPGPPPF